MRGIKFKFSFFSFMILIAFVLTAKNITYISLLAALVHEIGHITAAKLLGIKLSEFNFGLLGARLKTTGRLSSYTQETVLCFFGPLFNFLSFAIVLGIGKIYSIHNECIEYFLLSSLSFGIINLLPIRSFDGGRIFQALISNFWTPDIAMKIINVLSFISIFFLWCVSVYFLLIYSSTLNLFVFSFSLFCSIFINGEQ